MKLIDSRKMTNKLIAFILVLGFLMPSPSFAFKELQTANSPAQSMFAADLLTAGRAELRAPDDEVRHIFDVLRNPGTAKSKLDNLKLIPRRFDVQTTRYRLIDLHPPISVRDAEIDVVPATALPAINVVQAGVIGKGDKIAVDTASAKIMKPVLSLISHAAGVNIWNALGEGWRDGVPAEGQIEVRHSVLTGIGNRFVQTAIDPVDGTGRTAKGDDGGITVVADSIDRGFKPLPDLVRVYNVIYTGNRAKIDLQKDSPKEILKKILDANILDRSKFQLWVLNRPHHEEWIQAAKEMNVRVRVYQDGSMQATAYAATHPDEKIIIAGRVGASEAGISAANLLSVYSHLHLKSEMVQYVAQIISENSGYEVDNSPAGDVQGIPYYEANQLVGEKVTATSMKNRNRFTKDELEALIKYGYSLKEIKAIVSGKQYDLKHFANHAATLTFSFVSSPTSDINGEPLYDWTRRNPISGEYPVSPGYRIPGVQITEDDRILVHTIEVHREGVDLIVQSFPNMPASKLVQLMDDQELLAAAVLTAITSHHQKVHDHALEIADQIKDGFISQDLAKKFQSLVKDSNIVADGKRRAELRTLFATKAELLQALQGSVIEFGPENNVRRILNVQAFKDLASQLYYNYVYTSDPEIKNITRQIARQGAKLLGTEPASLANLYKAQSRGVTNFTIPSNNIRLLLFDTAQALLTTAQEMNAGAFQIELARSERVYTGISYDELVTGSLFAAIAAGYSGPLHFKLDHSSVTAKDLPNLEGTIKLQEEAIQAGVFNIDIDASALEGRLPDGQPNMQANIDATVKAALHARTFGWVNAPHTIITLGGEAGGVGTSVNTTPEVMSRFLSAVQEKLTQEIHKWAWDHPREFQNMLKIRGTKELDPREFRLNIASGQNVTAHGGLFDPKTGERLAKIDFDFYLMRSNAEAARRLDAAGYEQHGASTVPVSYYGQFVNNGVAEVHLATAFMESVMDFNQKHPELFNALSPEDQAAYLKTREAFQSAYQASPSFNKAFEKHLKKVKETIDKDTTGELARKFPTPESIQEEATKRALVDTERRQMMGAHKRSWDDLPVPVRDAIFFVLKAQFRQIFAALGIQNTMDRAKQPLPFPNVRAELRQADQLGAVRPSNQTDSKAEPRQINVKVDILESRVTQIIIGTSVARGSEAGELAHYGNLTFGKVYGLRFDAVGDSRIRISGPADDGMSFASIKDKAALKKAITVALQRAELRQDLKSVIGIPSDVLRPLRSWGITDTMELIALIATSPDDAARLFGTPFTSSKVISALVRARPLQSYPNLFPWSDNIDIRSFSGLLNQNADRLPAPETVRELIGVKLGVADRLEKIGIRTIPQAIAFLANTDSRIVKHILRDDLRPFLNAMFLLSPLRDFNLRPDLVDDREVRRIVETRNTDVRQFVTSTVFTEDQILNVVHALILHYRVDLQKLYSDRAELRQADSVILNEVKNPRTEILRQNTPQDDGAYRAELRQEPNTIIGLSEALAAAMRRYSIEDTQRLFAAIASPSEQVHWRWLRRPDLITLVDAAPLNQLALAVREEFLAAAKQDNFSAFTGLLRKYAPDIQQLYGPGQDLDTVIGLRETFLIAMQDNGIQNTQQLIPFIVSDPERVKDLMDGSPIYAPDVLGALVDAAPLNQLALAVRQEFLAAARSGDVAKFSQLLAVNAGNIQRLYRSELRLANATPANAQSIRGSFADAQDDDVALSRGDDARLVSLNPEGASGIQKVIREIVAIFKQDQSVLAERVAGRFGATTSAGILFDSTLLLDKAAVAIAIAVRTIFSGAPIVVVADSDESLAILAEVNAALEKEGLQPFEVETKVGLAIRSLKKNLKKNGEEDLHLRAIVSANSEIAQAIRKEIPNLQFITEQGLARMFAMYPMFTDLALELQRWIAVAKSA